MKKEGEEDDRDLSKLIPADTTLSAIPPLLTQGAPSSSSPSPSRKRTRAHELGLETERGRREKMSDLYALLQTMVPTLFPKATRVKIVSETAEYIKELERMRDRLEEMKKSKGAVSAATPTILVSQCSSADSSLRVTVSGNVAFFGIQTLRLRRGLASQIITVFEKHDAQVFAANVAANHGLLTVTVTAFVGNNGNDLIDKIISDIRNL